MFLYDRTNEAISNDVYDDKYAVYRCMAMPDDWIMIEFCWRYCAVARSAGFMNPW